MGPYIVRSSTQRASQLEVAMTHNGQSETSLTDTSPQKGLHEWAERVAVPTFDYIADPIEAVVDGLTHAAHHEASHRRTQPSRRPA